MSGTGQTDSTVTAEDTNAGALPADISPAVADAAGDSAAQDSPLLGDTAAAAEGAGEAAGNSPAPAGGEAPEGAADDAPKPAANDSWKAKKYDSIYAKLKAKEQEIEALKAGKAPVLDQEEVQRQAAALAEANEFNRRCNETAEAAKKQFPDFSDRVKDLVQIKTQGDPASEAAYGRLIAAAMETGQEAGRVIYELGGNLEEAERIMNLSPVKQAQALAAIAAKRGEPEPSNAPAPVKPVGQRAGAGELIKPDDPGKADKLSKDEWIRRRQADVDKKRAAGMRIW